MDWQYAAQRFVTSASFTPQDYVVESGWLEHGAFAGWLTQVLAPKMFVELGTHRGFSYFAFCQTIRKFELGTACFAVDTWTGDDHAGFYQEDVFLDITAQNEIYKDFSTLIRSTFEEAARYFRDGSVDLLHIDGRHCYEDVKRDYEQWAQKLAKNAVVLFHDTNVRERDFGVYQFFAELKEKFPTFEFVHGNGLGVLATGETPPALDALLRAGYAETSAVRSVYARLGATASQRVRAEKAHAEMAAVRSAFVGLETYVRKLEAELDTKARALHEAQAAIQHIEAPRHIPVDSVDGLTQDTTALVAKIDEDRGGQQRLDDTLSNRSKIRVSVSRLARFLALLGTSRPRTVTAPAPPSNSIEMEEAPSGEADVKQQTSIKEQFVSSAKADLAEFLSNDRVIDFTSQESPSITVVIILWNKAHFTLRCLTSLAQHSKIAMQVVVVDNGSTDETRQVLAKFHGLTIISNAVNEGFVVACNQGARAATADVLLLLNNDAFVRNGSIEKALITLLQDANVGVVGGRLLLSDGSTQEGGSIVWSDGSSLGYGRGWASTKSELMYRRDVDYCSGAFLMTRKELWEKLGGFDEDYSPAYYEEADYCMRVWGSGARVVYEPDCIIDHFEFGSTAGSNLSQTLMLSNRKRFRKLHHRVLDSAHLPPSPANILSARAHRGSARRRLLLIDNFVPLSIEGAGFPRAKEILLSGLRSSWDVALYPLHQLDIDWNASRAEIPSEIEIVGERGISGLKQFLLERRSYYDVVMISRPDNMRECISILADGILDGTRVIYDAEAIFAVRNFREAALEGTVIEPADAAAAVAAEVSLSEHADAISCVSDCEAEIFSKECKKPVFTLSHTSRRLDRTPGHADRSGLLFVGRLMEHHSPNWRGLSWFVSECWPLIRAKLPDVKLTIIGRLHEDHAELAAPGVTLIGSVPDITPFYTSTRVFIAPIQFAAGIPLKIIEASMASMPSAGTRLMAELLKWRPGKDMIAEDHHTCLASAIVQLHEDRDLWAQVRAAAQSRAAAEYSAEAFDASLSKLLSEDSPPGRALKP